MHNQCNLSTKHRKTHKMDDSSQFMANDDSEIYKYMLHAGLAVLGLTKKEPAFLQKAIRKRQFILQILPSSCPLILRSFESATVKFFKGELIEGTVNKRRSKYLARIKKFGSLNNDLPPYSPMHDKLR